MQGTLAVCGPEKGLGGLDIRSCIRCLYYMLMLTLCLVYSVLAHCSLNYSKLYLTLLGLYLLYSMVQCGRRCAVQHDRPPPPYF